MTRSRIKRNIVLKYYSRLKKIRSEEKSIAAAASSVAMVSPHVAATFPYLSDKCLKKIVFHIN